MCPLTKPDNSVPINDFSNILKCKMHAYVAHGAMDDDEIPETATELDKLMTGPAQVFEPLGDLAKDGLEFFWKRESEQVHAGKKRGALEVGAMVKSLAVTPEMIKLLDDPAMDDAVTVIFVPFKNPAAIDVDADNPAFAVIVRNVNLVDNGKGNGSKKYGEVTLEFTGEPDKIEDSLIMLKLTVSGVVAP